MRPSFGKKIFLGLAVLGLLIFLHFISLLSPLESAAVRLTAPIFSSSYSAAVKIRQFYNSISNAKQLTQTIEKLEKQASRLAVDNARLQNLEEENKQLRNYLNFAQTKKIKYVMANVVSRRDSLLIIDQGQQAGLKEGLAVVNEDGVAIGKIIKVKPQLSQVALITDKHCQLAASVMNAQKTNGLAKGELGLTISLDYIPQTENIQVNDLVVTSGLEPDIVRGLPIGRVVKIEKNSNELWQKAVLEPVVNLDHLTIVMVLLP